MDVFPHFIDFNMCSLGQKLSQKQPRSHFQCFLVRTGRGKVTRSRRPRGRAGCAPARSHVRVTHAFVSPGVGKAMANYISNRSPER
ncbi:uncharacterized protein DS421_8g237290 [Arachis hypogaea]|nr:uncharacterized protein DS421_8g237290 [Arachis hypogaea]